eukprot:8904449-Pyramimonas_sp.AAC.1
MAALLRLFPNPLRVFSAPPASLSRPRKSFRPSRAKGQVDAAFGVQIPAGIAIVTTGGICPWQL